VSGTTASHLAWWRSGSTGWLRFEIRMTPQRPQRLQTLNVRAVHQPSEMLMSAARSLADALSTAHPHWPAALTHDESFNPDALLRSARLAFALDGAAVLDPAPVSSTSADAATFELHSAHLVWEMAISFDAATAQVVSCTLTQRALSADARTVLH